MKLHLTSLIFLLLLATMITETSAQNLLASPHFLEARKKAEEEKKQLLVHFTASWSNPCSKMFSTTYRDQEIRNLLQKELVFTLIDIDDFDGYVLSQHYNINNLPTLVLFDKNGRTIKRHQGKLSVQELKDFLGSEGEAEITPLTAKVDEVQPGMMERLNNAPKKEVEKKTESGQKNQLNTTVAEQIDRDKKGEYYAIQLGAFTDKNNAEKMLNSFSSYSIQDLHLQSELLNERERFLLLGGKFPSREKAEQKLVELRNNGQDGFIKFFEKSNS